MHKSRLEAFSDGVIAIIITIMVLELKVPHGDTLYALIPLFHTFVSYALSFIYLAIYWNNHHHLFQAVSHVNGKVLWANMLLLFWLSLVPFATGWLGDGHFKSGSAVAFYGIILLMAATSFRILTRKLISTHGKDSVIAKALKHDLKGKLSLLAYAVSVPLAFYSPLASFAVYWLVAAIWFIPDKRIEKLFS
jgi:uncharacterized membrane protein